MKKMYLIVIFLLLVLSGTSHGYLLENIDGGTGTGYVSIDVGQGASSGEIRIGTNQWVSAGDLDRSINALQLEDAVLLFTTGSTVDASWLSDTLAWTLSSETTSSSQYVTTITRAVGGSTVTVKATTTLNPFPNKVIDEKFEISVTGDDIEGVKLFAYADFNLDLGAGHRGYPVGNPENPSGYDVEDYSYVIGTPGATGGDDFTLVAYDSFVSSGSVPAPPINQVDVSIGLREKGTVSPTKWEINEFSTLSAKLQDLVDSVTTDLDLLNSDATSGTLKDTEFAFQFNLGTITSGGGSATVEFEKAINPVPEPATILLIGIGLAGLGILNRKK